MAARHPWCVLARALSRPPEPWRHRARHGPAAGPQAGQARLTYGGAASPDASERSRRLLSPQAPHTGACQSHDGHGPEARTNSFPHVPGYHTLSGTRCR